MRAQQPVIADVLRQGRRAVVFATVASAVAALPILAGPVFVWHAVDVAMRQTPVDTLLPLGTFLGLLMGARLALLAARDHILLRAALWFQHVAGRRLLAVSIGTTVHARNLILARRAIMDLSGAGTSAALTGLFDMAGAVVAALALCVIHPLFGAIALLVFGVGAGLASATRAAMHDRTRRLAEADERAAEAWRLTAHNAGALAHHGLGDGMINDWQTLNAVAVTHVYRADRATAWVRTANRAVVALGAPMVAGIAAWLVVTQGLALGAGAAAVMLIGSVCRPVAAAVDGLPDLTLAAVAYRQLTGVVAGDVSDGSRRGSAAVEPTLREERAS